MAKRLNPNLAKIHRNYTVTDVAELFDVHKNTVRTWIKSGLEIIDEIKPILILGSELRNFLQSKRAKNKRKCKLNEIYCVRCKKPQMPSGNMVDYEPMTDTTGRLIGICPTCENIINKYFSFSKLSQIEALVDITTLKALEHIYKRD